MTPLHILQGTRMGRKVLTKEEFYEQVKNGALKADEVEVIKKTKDPSKRKSSKKGKGGRYVLPTPEEVLMGPSSSQTTPTTHRLPYFVAPGRFSVGDIEKVGHVYVFRDLELPMGTWERLGLSANRIPENPREFNEWADYTRGSGWAGVMPVDVRYGLMTVCYLNRKKKPLKQVIESLIRQVWHPDVQDGAINSTRVTYREKNSALINPGVGWGQYYPFHVQYESQIAGGFSQIGRKYATSDRSLYSALEGLIGENDPERCAQVLMWSSGYPNPCLTRIDKVNRGICNVVIGIHGNCPELIADFSMTKEKPARAILADTQYFTKI